MKAGTATKMILNMISTATMISMGKVYGNLMIDLMAVNDKLVDRGTRIIQQVTGLDYDSSKEALFEANKYFNDQEPWKKKEDPIRLNTIVYTTLEIVRKVSFLLYPIIPQSVTKALKIFDIDEGDINLSSVKNNEYLLKGSKINKIDILFKKIEKNND